MELLPFYALAQKPHRIVVPLPWIGSDEPYLDSDLISQGAEYGPHCKESMWNGMNTSCYRFLQFYVTENS